MRRQLIRRKILLTVDAMIGQDAVNVAQNFQEKLPLTGIILTRLDGDMRGGCGANHEGCY